MERVEAELFTDAGNDAVVRLPGRRFPGVLVQGDTLRILSADVAELVELCAAGDLEARQAASLIQEELGAKLQRYTDALDAHGERHPF
ncbi:hypothetical protein GCM10014715_56640 [Streptomyces spiralis]|uniref:Uncharacterized protein n=1 Tax=Streptomyces spiralis TaxID=66376 RepID=A0A919AB56_9ACTN|nr:hypothetical protein [Streptomyces spiralis]GHE93007.1 hypothetical protein GCM10014715_56640 [Streptomyces spiralis]